MSSVLFTMNLRRFSILFAVLVVILNSGCSRQRRSANPSPMMSEVQLRLDPSPSAARPELVLQVGHSGGVTSVAFSSDGNTLASGSSDGTIRLWDLRTGELKRTLTGHDRIMASIAFSPDGKWLANGSRGGTIKLWDASNERLLTTLLILPSSQAGKASPDWIAFTPEGYYDSSPEAKQFIRWRVGDELLPAERYEKTYHRPDFVQKALRGER